jgi:hypothetical protein
VSVCRSNNQNPHTQQHTPLMVCSVLSRHASRYEWARARRKCRMSVPMDIAKANGIVFL